MRVRISRTRCEVRTSNAPAIALYEQLRLSIRRDAAALLPRHGRGRDDHVGRPRAVEHRCPRVILALETSCDDTCAAVVTRAGAIKANVISSQGIHDRYGGVVPEIASRHHLELIGAVVEDALSDGRLLARGDRARGSDPRSRPGGALLVGVSTAKALAAAHELPLAPVDHLHGHVAASLLGPTPFAPPFLGLIASGGHTLLARVTDPGPRYRGDRADARRRGRRGVRQGRAAARARLSRRRRARAARPRRRSVRFRVPDRTASCPDSTSRSPG